MDGGSELKACPPDEVKPCGQCVEVVQRLIEANLLHFTDEGWTFDPKIWNAPRIATRAESETPTPGLTDDVVKELVEIIEPLLGIIDEGVSCNISAKELREAHPEDRSFIKRTRKAVANAKAALAKARTGVTLDTEVGRKARLGELPFQQGTGPRGQ